jgi:hypothetical protein
MTAHDRVLASTAVVAGEQPASLSNWIKSVGPRLAAWAGNCANRWTAAAMYERLSALSDAELARRGLSRATLTQDAGAARDQNAAS